MFFCDRCEDTGFTSSVVGTVVECECCKKARSMVKLIQRTIDECYKKHMYKDIADLSAILEFLPEYPVMAVLEAYAKGIDKKIICNIMETFRVKKVC
jgi:hypothetical protein